MISPVPERAIAARPWYQAASVWRKSSSTLMEPSAWKSIEACAPVGLSPPGRARMKSSTPKVSQVGPSWSCKVSGQGRTCPSSGP
jgi:hypothetical protein